MTPKRPGMTREKLRRGRASAPEKRESRWRNVISGRNWVVVLLVTAIVGVAVPQLFPAAVDSVRDVLGGDPVTIEAVDASDVVVGVPVLATSSVLPAVHGISEMVDSARQAGGQPAGFSGQQLTFHNHRSSTILVTDIRPLIEQRGVPLDGTLVRVSSQGTAPTSVLTLDLDKPQPLPTGGDQFGEPFFLSQHIELQAGETDPVHLRTTTQSCDCTWRLRVTYRYHSSDHTVLVPAADAAPFRMTAYAAKYRAVYRLDPDGVHSLDPKTYCADDKVCRAARPSCGTVRTGLGQVAVRVLEGDATCTEALRITNRYYNDRSITTESTTGFAVVDGWVCVSSTASEQKATGHYADCTRDLDRLSVDAT